LTPEEEELLRRLDKVQRRLPERHEKGFWAKLKEVLGA
jgi:hypothetical protein